MKPPVNQKPAEQKSDSKSLSLNGTSGLELKPVLKSGTRRSGRKTKRQGRRKNLSLPPQLECSPVYGAWFRFDTVSTVSNQVITKANLMAVPGVVGTVVNTTGYTVSSAVRIKKVRAWPAAGGEVNIQWNGSPGKTRDEAKDVSLPTGITVDRMLELTPPPGSFASLWWEAGETSVSIMQISATNGTIIDLLLDFTLSNSLGNSAVTFAGIAVGGFYYGYLDGNTTHQFRPLGRNTTF